MLIFAKSKMSMRYLEETTEMKCEACGCNEYNRNVD